MNLEERINQFKNMAQADPDNELGHFSLGKAYLDAERYAEAEPALQRTLELKPTYSKAYQLLGRTQLKLGKRDQAVATLKKGYHIAAERGDVMPRDEMAAQLTELGEELPKLETKVKPETTAVQSTGKSDFRCSRCGRPDRELPERPFKGALGEKVLANVCADCWREWIGMGTKVINEMGLQLSDPQAQAAYDEHMKDFLQLQD